MTPNRPHLKAGVWRAAFLIGCVATCIPAPAQTLFVPSGTSGIGSSANGNVGVGTSSPANELEVRGIARFSNGTDYGWIFSGSSGGLNAFHVGSFTNVPLAFFTNASAPKMTLDVSGNLGLGTTTPAVALQIKRGDPGLIGPYYNHQLRVDTNLDAGIVLSTPLAKDAYFFHNTPLDGASAGFKFGGTGRYIAFFTVNGTERMRIDNLGNVGIGTSTPNYPLSLGTGIGSKVALYDAGGGNGYGFGIQNNLLQIFANTSADRVGIGYGNSANFSETLTVKGANVGIGTTSPTHKLAVNGTIRAKEVIVDTGWADHVFATGYRLAPLSEVERHIQQNGHLPDVPSAAEVAARGVSVGEMQTIILQKVEELTLHLIRLEKENAALRAENARVQERLQRVESR